MREPGPSSLGFLLGPLGDRAACGGASGLLVAFAREAERWTHALSFADVGAEVPIARAVEGRPERDGPARVISPVYQDAQLHGPGGPGPRAGASLLLTGQSFAHHFSAVVGRVEEAEATEAFDFDVADRCRAPVEGLAATYEMGLDRLDLVDAAPDRAAWSFRDVEEAAARACLELRALEGCSIAMGPAGPRTVRVQVVAPIGQGAFTYRLRYRWLWSASV